MTLERAASCEPIVTGLVRARDCGLADHTLSHAGAPFADRASIPKPVLHALAGAAMIEGWVRRFDDGVAAVQAGDVALVANHSLAIVSPMAGVVRPSQPLFAVRDGGGSGRVAYATLAEKGRRTLRFGCCDDQAVHGLAALENDIAPAVAAALPSGGLPILPILAEAVALGDDVHQRNVGGHLVLLRSLPQLDAAARVFLADHPQFFLNFAMASAKLTLDGWRGIAGSSLVTAITRNGLTCAIQLAGTGDTWFEAPSVVPVGGIFAPHTQEDAQADLGDSAIMEAFGLGGCIAHLAPELTRALVVDLAEAVAAGHRQRRFFAFRNDRLSPVAAGEAGIGLGLDARRVLASDDDVRIHTGIAHKDGRSGWIGIGVANVPRSCFEQAMVVLEAQASGTETAVERA